MHMDPFFTTLGIIMIVLMVCSFLFIKWQMDANIRCIREEKLSSSSMQDIVNELNALVELEFMFALELPYEGKDVKRITDFESVLQDITQGVMACLDQETFFARARYAGLSDEMVYNYITRQATLRVISYMKETNTGITPRPIEEEE